VLTRNYSYFYFCISIIYLMKNKTLLAPVSALPISIQFWPWLFCMSRRSSSTIHHHRSFSFFFLFLLLLLYTRLALLTYQKDDYKHLHTWESMGKWTDVWTVKYRWLKLPVYYWECEKNQGYCHPLITHRCLFVCMRLSPSASDSSHQEMYAWERKKGW